jgi:hypothetical protein
MVAAWLVVLSVGIPAQEPPTLRYRWTQGETLLYRTTQQTVTAVSGMPGAGDAQLEQTVTQDVRMVVENVDAAGTATIRNIIDALVMEMTSPMGTIGFDSARPAKAGDPASEAMGQMLSKFIGQSFTTVLLPTGRLEKVEGFAAMMEKMAGTTPQDPGMAAAMKGLFSEESVRNMMSLSFGSFPDRPLKTGDTWVNQSTMSMPVTSPVTTSITMTMKGLEGSGDARVARIGTALSMKQDPSAPAAPNPLGFAMQIGDSSGDGELIFDVSKGRLLRTTTRLAMPMTMAADGAGMNMKMLVKSTTTMELVPR